MMKYRLNKFLSAVAVLVAFLAVTFSCTISNELDAEEIQQVVFDAWMAENRPELLENFQSEDGYYIDIVTVGDTSLRPIGDTLCWVKYDLTGYDLWGNVCITRNDMVAWQQGTFQTYTHYSPYYRLSDIDTDAALEVSQLAFCNKLKVGNDEDVMLYNGAEFTLYSPTTIAESGGTTGYNGYGGQYILSNFAIILKIKVTEVIYDPVDFEEKEVHEFAELNGGLSINSLSFPDGVDSSGNVMDDSAEWTNAVDSISYIYINTTYKPSSKTQLSYVNPYVSTVPDSPYSIGITELDKLINTALEDRFSSDYTPKGEYPDDDDILTVWYVGRFLDGFIFDTNIDEVKEIIYGDGDYSSTAISYDIENDEDSYIRSWYYAIPQMRYGNWTTLLTVSGYAYGDSGYNADTSASSLALYDYYNYYGYYDDYYAGYSYYTEDYDYSSYTGSGSSSSASTEIPIYCPLIFEIYIEADYSTDDDDDDDDDDE